MNRGVALEDGGLVDTVEAASGGQGGAGQGGEGRQHVAHGSDGARGGTRGDGAGPPGDAGHADASLEGGSLAAAERSVGGSLVYGSAVVGHEEHEGSPIEAEFAQGVEDLADAPVDLLNPVAEETVGRFAAELLARVEREVDGVMGEVEEERTVAALADERNSALGEAAGVGGLVGGTHAADDRVALDERKGRLVHAGSRAVIRDGGGVLRGGLRDRQRGA